MESPPPSPSNDLDSWDGPASPVARRHLVAPRPEVHEMYTPREAEGPSMPPVPPLNKLLGIPVQRPEVYPLATPRSVELESWRSDPESLSRDASKSSTNLTSCDVAASASGGRGSGRRVSDGQSCQGNPRPHYALKVLVTFVALGACCIAVLWTRVDFYEHQDGISAVVRASGPCTHAQLIRGCAPGFCDASGKCACEPNLLQVDSHSCSLPLEPHRMVFHVYRLAGDGDDHDGERSDDALAARAWSLQGVLWFLHTHVVVESCPRKSGITRIRRFRATVFNTEAPFLEWRGQFGPPASFVNGRCVDRGCPDVWRKYGFVVGCEPWSSYLGGASYGNRTQRYTLPDECPSQERSHRDADCGALEPGGRCDAPNGGSNCTWRLEPAGELRLDALVGIEDYATFCEAGYREYNETEDRGSGLSFWDDRANETRNAERVRQVQMLFADAYPNTALPEPKCDSQQAQCKYHEGCKHLSGLCCPAADGRMLACCGNPGAIDTVF
eukprot:TRINITY_DN56029_c0_g1_i2.p1 TRINITY_DN56029_c0_g1~~TRINITY_DN56029_c0_g1_i2.p1  ORF type:complete len:512 (-),score=73.70 TRINITY_DN56029_c0_g1_i2:112-1608(-)